MVSFKRSFENTDVVIPYPNCFLWMAASVAEAAAADPNAIKTVLANVSSTFFIKDKAFFSNGLNSLVKNPSGCPISWN